MSYAQTIGDTFVDAFITYEITSLSPNRVKVTDYNTAGGTDVVIPNSVTPNSSGRVSGSANTNNRMITYIVTSIGNSAFQNKGLTSLFIPPNVTSIGNGSFAVNDLTTVTIPDSVTSIGNQSFISNDLTSLILGNGLTSIGGNAFDLNSTLTCVNSKATTPPTIFTGNGDTFGAANRANIDLLVPVGTNNTYVAATWTGFKTIQDGLDLNSQFLVNNIRYKVTSVVNSTVSVIDYDISGGSVVNIPATVIGACTSEVFNVTGIADSAFANLTLTNATVPDSVTSIGNFAFSNTGIISITLSNTLTTIGNQAFQSNNLSSVTFFDGLISIGDYAFQGNQLSSVTFPASVTSIGLGAFRTNMPLASVTSLATIPPTITTGGVNDTFDIGGDRSGIDLTIPTSTEGLYVTDPGALWINFNSVILNISDFELVNDIKIITSETEIKIISANTVNLQSYGLYNMTGAKVLTGTDSVIPTIALASGVYILKLDFTEGTIIKKIAK